jgi:AAA15 family ATPase/GTPase
MYEDTANASWCKGTIVTTHESRLLDFDLLRRDEVWFVDKNEKGESSIYSLEAYNERFDKKIDKAYLEGRYGGVPIFSSIFPVKKEAKCE